jgi:hypothetical protein
MGCPLEAHEKPHGRPPSHSPRGRGEAGTDLGETEPYRSWDQGGGTLFIKEDVADRPSGEDSETHFMHRSLPEKPSHSEREVHVAGLCTPPYVVEDREDPLTALLEARGLLREGCGEWEPGLPPGRLAQEQVVRAQPGHGRLEFPHFRAALEGTASEARHENPGSPGALGEDAARAGESHAHIFHGDVEAVVVPEEGAIRDPHRSSPWPSTKALLTTGSRSS